MVKKKTILSLEVFEIALDNNFKFQSVYRRQSYIWFKQLITSIRLKHFLRFEDKKIPIKSHTISNSSYCLLVLIFSSAKSFFKIENIQKIAFIVLFLDYEVLRDEKGKAITSVIRIKTLCTKIIKNYIMQTMRT